MPKKLLFVLLLTFLFFIVLGGYLFAKYRQLNVGGSGGLISPNFEVEFKDEIGLKGTRFNKKPFIAIAEELGIWQNGYYDWQSSKNNPLETPKLIRPQKIVLVLTLEEQGFFRAKEMKAEKQLVTISSFGQKIEDNTLYLIIHFEKDFLDKLPPEALPDTLNYRTTLALYKMSQVVQKIESPALAIEQNAKLANDFIGNLLSTKGQIFTKKGISFNKFRMALANLTLVKIASAQTCNGGLIICGTTVPVSASCSVSAPAGQCTTGKCGQRCGFSPYFGTCNCTYTCDIGDDVNTLCSLRDTQQECGLTVCANPPYDCKAPGYGGSCSWSSGCSCTSWVNGACGGGSCAASERRQTRTCTPSGCSSESRCVSDASCGGPPPPSCTVDLVPATAATSIGNSVTLTTSITVGSGSVDRVDFTSLNTGVVTVNPASDSIAVYSTQATGVANGSTTVRADVVMSGATTCTDTSNVDVSAPGPWWQVGDADVTSGGDIISPIPATCSLPVCNPVFNLKGSGGFPGIPLYAGATADFQAGSGTGTVAESPYSWLVNTNYSASKIYDFSYFQRQIPSDVTFTEITSPTYNGGDFNSGGSPARGYVWYHYDGATLGDMTISGNVNLTGSRRVVLLVDGADLYITGRINVQSPGNGYFMVVVGKDVNGLKGNIIVDPTVSHPTNPAIEGVYLTEGEFRTGAGANRLYVRGAIAAYDGIVLERDLGADNDDTPAEFFEYAPDIIATFPQVFTSRRMRWKEVAP